MSKKPLSLSFVCSFSGLLLLLQAYLSYSASHGVSVGVGVAHAHMHAHAHVVRNEERDSDMMDFNQQEEPEEEKDDIWSKWWNLHRFPDESDVLDVIEEVDALVSEDSDGEDSEQLEKPKPLFPSKTGKKHVQELVENGMYTAAEQLVALYRSQGVELSSSVFQSISTVRRRLSNLADALSKRSIPRIAPAFQWAQSPESIFLNVKFAHKFDTPSTLGCETEKMVILDKKFTYEARCKEKRKIFSLDLTLYDAIDNETSTWSMASVGRAMFTLQKKQAASWSRLLKSTSKPGNMHVWWDMKAQYESSMRDFEREQSNRTRQDENHETNGAQADPLSDNITATAQETSGPSASEKEQEAVDTVDKQIKIEKAKIDKELRANITEVDREAKEERKRLEEKLIEDKADVESKASEKRRYYRNLASEKKKEIVDRLKNNTETTEVPSTGAGDGETSDDSAGDQNEEPGEHEEL